MQSYLYLDRNSLSSTVPSQLANLDKMSSYFKLQNNKLCGTVSEEVKTITTPSGVTRWDTYWNGQGYNTEVGSENAIGSVCGWVYDYRFDGDAALGNTVVHYHAESKTVSSSERG